MFKVSLMSRVFIGQKVKRVLESSMVCFHE